MRLVIDMNLSPEWKPFFRKNGFDSMHWSEIGSINAQDTKIMQWARENNCAVFTHDLDFGSLLAHSKAGGPSVIQVRTEDVSPDHLGPIVLRALHAHGDSLEDGVLMTIDESKCRVRILPI